MSKVAITYLVVSVTTVASAACNADQPATKLTNKEATTAIRALMEVQGHVALGTCVPALKSSYKDQVACTLLLISQGGTSETQADFHWDGKKWVVAPSESQDILPFPDPALSNIHAWTPDVEQLEPHYLDPNSKNSPVQK